MSEDGAGNSFLTNFVCNDSVCPSNDFSVMSGWSSWIQLVLSCGYIVSYSRTQHSNSSGGETHTSNPSILSLTLYQATVLGSNI